MTTDTAVPVPKLFMPHPNLSDEVNRNIVQSEIEGGVYLDNLSDGEVLEVETQNRWYTIVVGRRGKDLIWGHPQYCPEPVAVKIEGSTWGGSMLKVRFVGRGMRLEFQHPTYRRIVTSRIVEIRAGPHSRARLERVAVPSPSADERGVGVWRKYGFTPSQRRRQWRIRASTVAK